MKAVSLQTQFELPYVYNSSRIWIHIKTFAFCRISINCFDTVEKYLFFPWIESILNRAESLETLSNKINASIELVLFHSFNQHHGRIICHFLSLAFHGLFYRSNKLRKNASSFFFV